MDLQHQQKAAVLCSKYLHLILCYCTESPVDDDSLDDEPLSEIAKKLKSKHQKKESVVSSRKETPVMKSKRNAALKKGGCEMWKSEHTESAFLAEPEPKLNCFVCSS